MFPYIKFQVQRTLRRYRREFRRLHIDLQAYLRRHVWGKWRQLGIIRRFVFVWWALLAVGFIGTMFQLRDMSAYYLAPGQSAGGIYREGVVGEIKNINPILPENEASADVSRLVFSGLTRYTPERQIEGDLAERWTVSPDGKSYTFHLRQGVKWHDGVPFTARDVLFTLTAIQSPDTRSPLAGSWQGIKADAKDDHTVIFTLPSAYSPFIYSTTVGLLPSHRLESTDPSALRADPFNQHPIGTGPFKMRAFLPMERQIELDAYAEYYDGKPLLDGFIFRLFTDAGKVNDAYAKRQIDAIGRLRPTDQPNAKTAQRLTYHLLSLPSETNLFLRTTAPNLKDKAVRNALLLGTDRAELLRRTLGDNGELLSSPLLPGQLGYNPAIQQADYDFDKAAAALDAAGWKVGADGVRAKDGQQLQLKLVTSDRGEYTQVAQLVKEQWQKLGVKVELVSTDVSDLQQSYIRPRAYDVLLYGINIGADPDVYSFWHSSQASDPGLNLSQFATPDSDKALEAARLITDPVIRRAKYGSFLTAWNQETPAIVLYNPYYIYATAPDVMGIKAKKLVDPSDRFYGVEDWSVRTSITERRNLQ